MSHKSVLNTYRHVLLYADTRTAEFVSGTITGLWGVWLSATSLGMRAASEGLIEAVNRFGGFGSWASITCAVAAAQLVAVWFRYPNFRKWSALAAAVVLTTQAWCLLSFDGRLFSSWFTVLGAAHQLWIGFHRTAITEVQRNVS